MISALHLVAEDLTGALDSAAAFARPAMPVTVSWAPSSGVAASLSAYSTETRDCTADIAVSRTLAAADIARERRDHPLLFKKLDSLLRGHPVLELATFAEKMGCDRIVLAPAHPSLGRITREGWQYARDLHGRFERIPIDLAGELQATGFETRCGHAVAEKPTIVLADAETDTDLQTLVARERNRGGRILWCGSGGLAQSLASTSPHWLPIAAGRMLAIIGTDHRVTHDQIEAIARRDSTAVLTWTDGDDPETIADRINRRLESGTMAVIAPNLAPRSRTDATQAIATMLTPLLSHVIKPDALFCSGGETLRTVCDALGAEALMCEGFVSGGVPLSQLHGGRWPGIAVMSKSGAFGSSNTLVELLMRGVSGVDFSTIIQ